jgi:hypothetical protein
MTWHDRMLRRMFVGLGVMVLGAVGLVVLIFAGDRFASPGSHGMFLLASLAVWGGGIAYLLVALRCRGCGLRLAAHSARHDPVGTTLRSLMGMTACPRCGFDMRQAERA